MALILPLLTACGGGQTQSNPPPNGSPAPDGRRPGTTIAPAATTLPVSTVMQPETGPVLSFRGERGNCIAALVRGGRGLLPSHCVIAGAMKFPGIESLRVRAHKILSAQIPELEELVLLDLEGLPSTGMQTLDLSSVPHPDALPFAYRLHLAFPSQGQIGRTPCLLASYDRAGLVQYRCDSAPGQSGAVLFDREERPLAIHLGRRGGLGYGVLLAAVAAAVLQDRPLTGRDATP